VDLGSESRVSHRLVDLGSEFRVRGSNRLVDLGEANVEVHDHRGEVVVARRGQLPLRLRLATV